MREFFLAGALLGGLRPLAARLPPEWGGGRARTGVIPKKAA